MDKVSTLVLGKIKAREIVRIVKVSLDLRLIRIREILKTNLGDYN